MGVQTRSSASSSPVKPKTFTKVTSTDPEEEPYKVFVLPCHTSEQARFVLLKHPGDAARRRFYFCPFKGIFELTRVKAGAHDHRSILFGPAEEATTSETAGECDRVGIATSGDKGLSKVVATNAKKTPSEGYVNKSAEIFVATPFDPIFILLPLVDRPASCSRIQSGEGLFRPFDDILDEQLGDDRHLRHVLTDPIFRPTLLSAMNDICDSVDAGDEQMYRLSIRKLYEYVLAKAKRLVQSGLPASLEDRFVTRSLEVPVLSIERERNTTSLVTEENDVAPQCLTPDVSESQSSTTSTITSVAISEASSATSAGIVDQTPSADLVYLQRVRTAMSFITASYLDPNLGARLAEVSIDCKAAPNFGPLDQHLQIIAKLRVEALATRSLSDFSKKRGFDDEEAVEDREDKKRKQEEEEKRKKSQESRGVRDLKKVNVSGMKKMSDFFSKKGPTAKSKL
jgi:Ydr279p protein family (RNase H2 complex component) wHTH domain/Ydr279p protein triple barrel domain